MARSNGPFGPPGGRAAPRRDTLASLQPQAPAQVPWPTQGYADHGQPAQAGPAYHFPPPEPDPNYGYNQPGYVPQQWGQQDQRGYDLAHYLPADGTAPFQQTAHHQHAYAEPDADYGDEVYEDEEPRRGRRWILIAIALVGAIGVGGALAYTYRSLIAPNHGRVPLVKAEHNVKVKPEQRGGKEFPGTDKKLPNVAGATPPPSEADTKTETTPDGPRKVKAIPVGPRPGQVAPPESTIPGITLEDAHPPGADPPREEPPKTPPVVTPSSSGRVTIGDPPPTADPPKADKADKDDDDPPAPPPPVVKPPAKAPSAGTKIATATAKTTGLGLGYVVVLSSKKTHMDAFKAYADAVEKHPQVLSGKTPDVQEADLGEKGIWYRAVVGPPGSRGAAVTLCNQLKAAGQDCWITEYTGS
jgi:SPOR domain